MVSNAGHQRRDWQSRLAQYLVRSWGRTSLVTWLLSPVALLYLVLSSVRSWAYQARLYKATRLPCSVIVIGNVIAGGAGKTPTTISIAKSLTDRGWVVGIISRGYGRDATTPQQAHLDTDPSQVGDEPLLMARATGLPVFVADQRTAAAQALLEAYPLTQVILCDDGLQHFALFRDLEICVFDDRGVGNGWLLPSGPLRERWPRKLLLVCGQSEQASFVLHTGKAPAFDGYRALRKLSNFAHNAGGTATELAQLLSARPLLALAGIAQPKAFFEGLAAHGICPVQTIALPDHVKYTAEWVAQWQNYDLICTEKDAVKLWKFRPDAWAVPLEQQIDAQLLVDLENRLRKVARSRISSQDGHQTS